MAIKVKGYEGLYEIADDGSLWSFNASRGRRKTPRQVKTNNTNSAGYCIVSLYKHGKKTSHSVHRLVAEHFIPNPHNHTDVNHIDGDKTNNDVSNLEWVTRQENRIHYIKFLKV